MTTSSWDGREQHMENNLVPGNEGRGGNQSRWSGIWSTTSSLPALNGFISEFDNGYNFDARGGDDIESFFLKLWSMDRAMELIHLNDAVLHCLMFLSEKHYVHVFHLFIGFLWFMWQENNGNLLNNAILRIYCNCPSLADGLRTYVPDDRRTHTHVYTRRIFFSAERAKIFWIGKGDEEISRFVFWKLGLVQEEQTNRIACQAVQSLT